MRFHNDMYVIRSNRFWKDLRQHLCRQQGLSVNEIDSMLVEVLLQSSVGGSGNLPNNDGVGRKIIKCRPLLFLDLILEVPNGLCGVNFDRKDASARFAEHQTIQYKN